MSRLTTAVIIAVLLLISLPLTARPIYSDNIIDVSWPNCSLKNKTTYKFGIVGVNGGLDFKSNPCLNVQATWFTNYNLYMNTGYPGLSYGLKFKDSPLKCGLNEKCLAYNWGYNAAKYSISYAGLNAAHSSLWWLDVETDNSWTNNIVYNRSVMEGAIQAVRNLTLFSQVGIYSSPSQWQQLMGNWQIKPVEWVATGSNSVKQALAACRAPNFAGGVTLYSQYTTVLDQNVNCMSLRNS